MSTFISIKNRSCFIKFNLLVGFFLNYIKKNSEFFCKIFKGFYIFISTISFVKSRKQFHHNLVENLILKFEIFLKFPTFISLNNIIINIFISTNIFYQYPIIINNSPIFAICSRKTLFALSSFSNKEITIYAACLCRSSQIVLQLTQFKIRIHKGALQQWNRYFTHTNMEEPTQYLHQDVYLVPSTVANGLAVLCCLPCYSLAYSRHFGNSLLAEPCQNPGKFTKKPSQIVFIIKPHASQ